MAAHYDTYDYPSYWNGREYEHRSEVEAIKSFLNKVPKSKKILEIGAGYGRLTPCYSFRGKQIYLSDPSSKLLAQAKVTFNQNNFKFIHSSIKSLPTKFKANSFDLIVCVRVMHHIDDVENAINIICSLLKNKGYLILEFANKKHFKAIISEFLKGNITFPLDIFPLDKRSPRSIKNKTLPFLNYHPEVMKALLTNCSFELLEIRSVSNIRNSFLKQLLPLESLISLEKTLQIPLGYIHFGPSIFVLAQKRS